MQSKVTLGCAHIYFWVYTSDFWSVHKYLLMLGNLDLYLNCIKKQRLIPTYMSCLSVLICSKEFFIISSSEVHAWAQCEFKNESVSHGRLDGISSEFRSKQKAHSYIIIIMSSDTITSFTGKETRPQDYNTVQLGYIIVKETSALWEKCGMTWKHFILYIKGGFLFLI